jgi:Clr5 domain
MAPLADQGMGESEGNPWMQPVIGLQDPEGGIPFFANPDTIQPENSLRDPENDIAFFINPDMIQPEYNFWTPMNNAIFDEILTNMSVTQEPVGGNWNLRTSSNTIDNVVANGSDSQSYPYSSIPRGDVAIEGIKALAAPSLQVADSNIEHQHLQSNRILAEEGQDELEYVTHGRTPQVAKRGRKNSGPSSEEWQRRKPEIYNLYVENNCSLKLTIKEMARNGFHAESVTLPVFSLGIIC